ncbi:hypothetical protein A0H81_13451 [Grifola frondosa]|uniref:AB hydrolase-1 domain-containing protein n=1 Tax=Grifola frondosa TaxID=5627 RepID=A0A1C7LPH0_GRIFR|nr:hypothetical protein A0H81_13451 [Grifola frondosa]
MPLAPVDDHRTQLRYEDSGQPGDSATYVTLVLIHGTIFHSPIFRQLIPFAAGHDLRLVSVNLRDYPGSTPYAPDEYAALCGDNKEKQVEVIRSQGIELATFLEWFIKTENIPPLSATTNADTTTGGIAILGWSTGNCLTLSMLGNADRLPEESRKLLENYFRAFIIYDPAVQAFGVPFPPLNELYSPIRDPSVRPRKCPAQSRLGFLILLTLTPIPLAIRLPLPRDFLAGIARDPMPDPSPEQQPTLYRMSPEEAAAVADFGDTPNAHVDVLRVDLDIFGANLRSALFDAKPDLWPRLRVVLVWCDMSPGDALFASWTLARMAAEHPGGRKLAVKRVEGGNHFWHWDQPEAMIKLLAGIL